MKNIILRILLVTLLALTLSAQTSFAEEQLDGGLYFVDPAGNQGEFYSFPAWSVLTSIKQSNLILQYPHENIFIYLDSLNKVATLKESISSGSFDGASKDYVSGDITGDFKDSETGKIISTKVENDFKVMSIE